jgi:hypothetical protein
MKYIESVKRSLRLGFPYVAIETPDYPDSIKALVKGVTDRGIVQWDMLRGAIGLNELGAEASAQLNKGEPPEETTVRLEACLGLALDNLPPKSVILIQDIHLFLETKSETERALIIQAIRNLRDAFKSTERTLIFLVPGLKLPVELANDVEVISAPLPEEDDIKEIAVELHKAARLPRPKDEALQRVADAMLGVTAFAAENAIAKNLSNEGVDFDGLWETKKRYIRQVGCLSVPGTVSRFDELGGLDSIKEYGTQIINGKRRPRLVVLLDEIDKWIASLGDSNGINADALGQVLSFMQDNNWDGITLPGFAGTGKTEWAKALGNEAGGMFLSMDLGGAKGGIVGDSERMIRQALAMLKAMGRENVLFVATCNDMAILQRKPELLRRLAYGIHFFDLPTTEEQAPIWELYLKKFEITDTDLPACDGWTGAEIKKVCKLADEFGLPLKKVAGRITPVCKTMGDGVQSLRSQAEKGGWLSAKTGRPYSASKSLSMSAVRKIAKN